MSTENKLITRDWLAIERTKLANERTFLAYFRTFLVFLGTGVTIIKLEFFSDIKSYGIILVIVSAILLFIGIYRLVSIRKRIRHHYNID